MPARSDLSARVRAGVRKPPRKEPAGRWVGVCRLWGFERAAAWVGGALAGRVDGGPTIAVASLSPRLRSAARFWRDRPCRALPGTQVAGPSERVGPRVRIRLAPAAACVGC